MIQFCTCLRSIDGVPVAMQNGGSWTAAAGQVERRTSEYAQRDQVRGRARAGQILGGARVGRGRSSHRREGLRRSGRLGRPDIWFTRVPEAT